jgi:hypothetical protein
MKRSHDAYTHELADQPPISIGSPSLPTLGSQNFDFYSTPNLQPSFPPLVQSKIISREEALNRLAACAPYPPSNSAAPIHPQPGSPHYDQHTAPTATSICCEPSMSSVLHSDHTLEFEIQQEMGMVWRGYQQTQQPIDTTSPVSSTHSSSPDIPWLDHTCGPVTQGLPEWQDLAPSVAVPPQAVQASILSINPFKRRRRLVSQGPQTQELASLGEKLRRHARQQARTISNELATSSIESQ